MMRFAFNNLTPTLRGMVLMFCGTICFAVMQSLIKYIAANDAEPMHPFEIAFFRNLLGLVALAPLVLRGGRAAFATPRHGLHLLRAVVQAAGMLSFFTAVTLIPLAEVTSLSFSAPLFATALAVVLLGERIRVRRMAALACGFVGVMIVLRPGFTELSYGAFLVILSSLCWGFAMIVIKALSRTDSALTLTLYAGIYLAVLTGIPAAFYWTTPTSEQLVWLLGIGTVGTIGHLAFAQSLKVAEMSAVLPLDFMRLVWVSAIGYSIFDEIPTLFTWGGGMLIFGSATYIAVREAHLARAARKSNAKAS